MEDIEPVKLEFRGLEMTSSAVRRARGGFAGLEGILIAFDRVLEQANPEPRGFGVQSSLDQL